MNIIRLNAANPDMITRGSSIKVDTELSSESTNPVSNGVITTAFAEVETKKGDAEAAIETLRNEVITNEEIIEAEPNEEE